MEETTSSPTYKWLTPGCAVAPQLEPANMAELAPRGFRSVINIRHAREPNQPMSSAEAKILAEANGLHYLHLPVRGSLITAEEKVRAFEAALDETPKPVIVYCETGARAAILWAFSAMRRISAGEALAACQKAGYDLSFFSEQLRERRRACIRSHSFLRKLAGFLRRAG
jgi:sulfide:quinone oxidoreductase